jgi:8-oxo-dGTP pyrophosphatase MutT (NUDIX family)
MQTKSIRRAVRAIVITEEREVLLMRTRATYRPAYWFTPGGGIEPGESDEVCLRRELQEELGLAGFELGPLLIRRSFTMDKHPRYSEQHDNIYVIHHPRFEPFMSDAREARTIDRLHFWPLHELKATRELIFPDTLSHYIHRYLDHGETHSEG